MRRDPTAAPAALGERLRRRLGGHAVDLSLRGLSHVGRVLPRSRALREAVEVERDVAYRDTGLAAHTLDVYRPRGVPGPLPVVLYVHGGGFRILSKDTHWFMGATFASRGYAVFNINYRLAPRHPFPAALEDACAAYAWVQEHAGRHGGDPTRLVLAGESAGGNLVAALTVAACYERPEPWARRVFDTGVVPDAVVAACAMLQVSAPERLRKAHMPTWIYDRIAEVTTGYIGGVDEAALADPLLILEGDAAPARPLAPFFAPVGTRDPLLADTRRLATALERHGARCEARYYPGEVHAFHAFVWREQARACWRDTFSFLGRVGAGRAA